jgi:hypothetical protein
MGRKPDTRRPRDASRAILHLAARQHGVVATRQLLELGVSLRIVEGRERSGWLRRLYRGVYAVGGSRLTWRGRWLAAVLACGDNAALSHQSAGALWKLRRPTRGAVEVTVWAAGGRRSRPGLRIHRLRLIDPADLSLHHGIRVTSPARTVLDLAASGLTARALERAADQAAYLRLCDDADLRTVLERNRGRAGTAALARLLNDHEIGSTLTRSELEERFLALCRGHALPTPLVNVEVLGLTVDFFWPDARVVVEVDGRASHHTRRGFQDDRDRDGLLTARGYRVLRFTWWDVTRRPAVVMDRVRRVLIGNDLAA